LSFHARTRLICIPITGFHASTEEQFAEGFAKALDLPPAEALAMRHRSRESAKRFSEEVFSERWLTQLDALVALEKASSK
jgi:alpha-1,2-mannosyltransferase